MEWTSKTFRMAVSDGQDYNTRFEIFLDALRNVGYSVSSPDTTRAPSSPPNPLASYAILSSPPDSHVIGSIDGPTREVMTLGNASLDDFLAGYRF